VLLPFIKDGFDSGDKAIHVVNPDQRVDHLLRLAAAGLDTAAAQECGQFELWHNNDTYLRDGRFDQDRMLDVFEQLARGNAKQGFPRSRIVGRMDWAADSRLFVDNVIEFESRVNDIWHRHNGCGDLHLPARAIHGRRRDRHHADASDGDHRRHPSAEPVLRSSAAPSA